MDGFLFDRRIAHRMDQSSLSDLPGMNSTPSQESNVTPLILAGTDEAGRGPLAGPVVAAAVVLSLDKRISGLNDSKALTEAKREELYLEISEKALATSVAVVAPEIIDAINILEASLLAMRQALEKLTVKPDLVLIDGNQKPRSAWPERTLIKGDSKSASIMAASILAKVTRDRLMKEYHLQYPHYGFDGHKGYACKQHLVALETYGPSKIHRYSFEPVRRVADQKEEAAFL